MAVSLMFCTFPVICHVHLLMNAFYPVDATSICPWYSADADHVSLGCCYGWTQALNSG